MLEECKPQQQGDQQELLYPALTALPCVHSCPSTETAASKYSYAETAPLLLLG